MVDEHAAAESLHVWMPCSWKPHRQAYSDAPLHDLRKFNGADDDFRGIAPLP